MVSAALLTLRMVFSKAFKKVLWAISAIGKWLVSDWRHGPLFFLALAFLVHVFVVQPWLREARDDAAQIAKDNRELFDAEVKAHAQSIANIRAASAAALIAAQENADRVAAEQQAINQEEIRDYETRLAAARDRYDRFVRLRLAEPLASKRTGASGADTAGLPGPGTDPARIASTPGDSRFPAPGTIAGIEAVCLTPEQAFIATQQALQLDALISVVERQQAIQLVPKEISSE